VVDIGSLHSLNVSDWFNNYVLNSHLMTCQHVTRRRSRSAQRVTTAFVPIIMFGKVTECISRMLRISRMPNLHLRMEIGGNRLVSKNFRVRDIEKHR
jgi:hypothetical protein